jgi:hypothetical protein
MEREAVVEHRELEFLEGKIGRPWEDGQLSDDTREFAGRGGIVMGKAELADKSTKWLGGWSCTIEDMHTLHSEVVSTVLVSNQGCLLADCEYHIFHIENESYVAYDRWKSSNPVISSESCRNKRGVRAVEESMISRRFLLIKAEAQRSASPSTGISWKLTLTPYCTSFGYAFTIRLLIKYGVESKFHSKSPDNSSQSPMCTSAASPKADDESSWESVPIQNIMSPKNLRHCYNTFLCAYFLLNLVVI